MYLRPFLQMPDPTRHKRAQRPYYIIGGVVLTLFLVIAVVVWILLQGENRQQALLGATATAEILSANETATSVAAELAASEGEVSQLSQAAASTVAAAQTATAIVAAFTPTATPTATPTSTPRPTQIPGQIGFYISNSESYPFTLADTIETGAEFAEAHINNDETLILEDAHFFMQPNTGIKFDVVTADSGAEAGISLLLFEGSDIFLDTGDYENGADVSPIGDTRISFLVAGSCLSVKYDEATTMIDVGCYDGVCRYRAEERDAPTILARGDLLRFDIENREVVEVRGIRPSEANSYQQMLLRTSSGRDVYNRCIRPLFPPTSTPSPTPTPSSTSTNTPSPSDPGSSQPSPPSNTPKPPTSTPAPLPTNSPAPTPTKTLVPTATNSRVPTVTNSPIPPTATPETPTATTQPPTATPETPTTTPETPTAIPNPRTATPMPAP